MCSQTQGHLSIYSTFGVIAFLRKTLHKLYIPFLRSIEIITDTHPQRALLNNILRCPPAHSIYCGCRVILGAIGSGRISFAVRYSRIEVELNPVNQMGQSYGAECVCMSLSGGTVRGRA